MSKRKERDESPARKEREKSHKKHKKHKSEKRGDHERISRDDYFEKAREFRVWLKTDKKLYFEDLTSDDALQYFEKFVRRWNDGKLDAMYYSSIPQHVLESIHRTKHKWGFVKNLNESERLHLASTKDTVDITTNKGASSTARPSKTTSPPRSSKKHESDSDDPDDRRKRDKYERKRYHKHKESVMEELAPKATGRDANIEKKREKAATLHGAARAKEDAKDGLDLSDDFLMGGSDDYQARIQRRKAAQDKRQDEKQQRVTAAQEAEAARMQKFLQDMGIQPGQDRITIAPRQ
ncbi:hypothetical protein SDRG_05884 [Saprolegnia diclina VS20]|uniref:Uncharacterized protein n=1 Tax=Saprolegnia diclina (strain VS20) TaxID=1156394 RepID=T0S107_SAPDV|nr:hypothetical protein SDRG_05884 [Saprolegnia diclina VS20]EQC36427.1 hypothetical protein SDRG_05884 [Saprolegnia diclina VS20]|eukprot:XP_008609848.1 hypothetical protein SDRG_05884 [Saprolegnia diclina VS20]